MLPLKSALFMSVVFLTQINISRITTVIKDLSTGLDVILSGNLRNAQSLSVVHMIGLLRCGMLEKKLRNSVAIKYQEINH
jgi:hypothetical protein